MKKNEKKELSEKTDDILKATIVEKQQLLFKLRSQAVTEKLENPCQFGQAKRDIARVKTILRQRTLAAAKK